MKCTCDFCKTGYNIPNMTAGPVRCAVCGNVWTVSNRPRKNSMVIFIAALTALLSAVIFAVVAIVNYRAENDIIKNPMIAQISQISVSPDGRPTVSGRIINRGADIRGVPGILVISMDADKNVLSRQKFLPPASLLEPGSYASFVHTLNIPADNVKTVSLELINN